MLELKKIIRVMDTVVTVSPSYITDGKIIINKNCIKFHPSDPDIENSLKKSQFVQYAEVYDEKINDGLPEYTSERVKMRLHSDDWYLFSDDSGFTGLPIKSCKALEVGDIINYSGDSKAPLMINDGVYIMPVNPNYFHKNISLKAEIKLLSNSINQED